MRACCVTDVGVIVDCIVMSRVESDERWTSTTAGGTSPRDGYTARQHTQEMSLSMSQQPSLSGFARTPSPASSETSSPSSSTRFVVRTSIHPQRDTIVDELDLLPFGFHAPSAVFAVRGRHFNRGLGVMVIDDGTVLLERYGSAAPSTLEPVLHALMPKPMESLLSKLGVQQEKTRQATAESQGGAAAAMVAAIAAAKANKRVLSCTMAEVQLLPMLSAKCPTLPLAVGTIVKARRRSTDPRKLHTALVVKANYDCSYTLRYAADGELEKAVLHNDVLLEDESNAEDIRVRDTVTVSVDHETGETFDGVVLMCLGKGWYRVFSRNTPQAKLAAQQAALVTSMSSRSSMFHAPSFTQHYSDMLVHRNRIARVSPKFPEALRSNGSATLLPIFRALDTEECGVVAWSSVIKHFSQHEYGGQPLTPTEWNKILHKVIAGRHHQDKAAERLLGKSLVMDAATAFLTFTEFEHVAALITTMKW